MARESHWRFCRGVSVLPVGCVYTEMQCISATVSAHRRHA